MSRIWSPELEKVVDAYMHDVDTLFHRKYEYINSAKEDFISLTGLRPTTAYDKLRDCYYGRILQPLHEKSKRFTHHHVTHIQILSQFFTLIGTQEETAKLRELVHTVNPYFPFPKKHTMN